VLHVSQQRSHTGSLADEHITGAFPIVDNERHRRPQWGIPPQVLLRTSQSTKNLLGLGLEEGPILVLLVRTTEIFFAAYLPLAQLPCFSCQSVHSASGAHCGTCPTLAHSTQRPNLNICHPAHVCTSLQRSLTVSKKLRPHLTPRRDFCSGVAREPPQTPLRSHPTLYLPRTKILPCPTTCIEFEYLQIPSARCSQIAPPLLLLCPPFAPPRFLSRISGPFNSDSLATTCIGYGIDIEYLQTPLARCSLIAPRLPPVCSLLVSFLI
jgi:hypothetical protein